MSRARKATEIFMSIVCDDAYANLALKDAGSDADGQFIRALIYTALEHLSYIDYILGAYIHGRQKKLISCILRLGVCQILFMSRPDSAVCNECVKLTSEMGKSALSGFVNAVLRAVVRDKEKDRLPKLPDSTDERLSIMTGYPMWLVREYIDRFGEAGAEAALTYKDDSTSIRPQYPYTRDELENYLKENNISYRHGAIAEDIFHIKGRNITESELFAKGCITIQSESSAVCCISCGDTRGKSVLDACAAPGGKSAYIYSLSQGECHLISCEKHEHRKELTCATFDRLHVRADVICADMTQHIEDFVRKFDVVLCDVPCSGLGVIGKPDARYRRDAEDTDAIAKLQYDILSTCAEYVKDGGILVYSTCTVSYRENEHITSRFLAQYTDFEAYDHTDDLPAPIRDRTRKGQFHIMPHTDGTDGFFIARFRRK